MLRLMIIPPKSEKGKMVEIYDLYLLVKKEGGHRRVSMYNLWVVIAKDLGFDYEDKDYIRILYAQYLDVIERQYNVKKTAIKVAESSKVERNKDLNEHHDFGLLHPSAESYEDDYALYMGGDWNAAKRLIKKRKFDFTTAARALDEANKTLAASNLNY